MWLVTVCAVYVMTGIMLDADVNRTRCWLFGGTFAALGDALTVFAVSVMAILVAFTMSIFTMAIRVMVIFIIVVFTMPISSAICSVPLLESRRSTPQVVWISDMAPVDTAEALFRTLLQMRWVG